MLRPLQHKRRRGWTLIELLSVAAILGLLVSLTMPAVQSARESARRTQCRSQLRQIGLGLAQYETAHGMFPPGGTVGGPLYGPLVAILPHVGLDPLARHAQAPIDPALPPINEIVVGLYQCPSDPFMPQRGATNYGFNGGTWKLLEPGNGLFQHWRRNGNGPVGPIRAAEVRDGLSHTAAASEVLPWRAHTDLHRLRGVWETPDGYQPNESQAFLTVCRSLPEYPMQVGWKASAGRGENWTHGEFGHGLYNHALTPNLPSCLNQTGVQTGIYTAASMHPGGVHVLFADGRVTFASDKIDLRVWRALGSIAGLEPVGQSF